MQHVRRRWFSGLLAAALLAAGLPTLAPARADTDSSGAEFWLAFPQNTQGFGTRVLTLFITGPAATTGTVDIPSEAFTAPFSVTPGSVTSVVLPNTAQISNSDVVEDRGIHVTALDEVIVYGLSYMDATTDGYLGLPVDFLGTEYIALGFENSTRIPTPGQLAVVGTEDGTTVTITPTVTVGARTAGVPYDIVVDEGDTYMLEDPNPAPSDLSGTVVSADRPVAVFGGHRCADVPSGVASCDHLVEQLLPTSVWGRSFVSMPLASRVGGDTFRFLAGTDDTSVSVNGVEVEPDLDRGEVHQQVVNGPAEITATEPILVAQYANGQQVDNMPNSDPTMTLIPSTQQFLASYTVSTPASGIAANFVNVVVPDSAVGLVTLDGVPVPALSYTAIGTSGYSGAQLSVAVGTHNLVGPEPFGLTVYGFDNATAYGYPGGFSLPLAPDRVASVSDVAVVEGAGNAVFTVSLDGPDTEDFVFDYTTVPGSAGAADFTATAGQATIPAGQTSIDIDVPITDDTTDEPTETFTLVISEPSSLQAVGPLAAVIGDATGVGTILDDDLHPCVAIRSAGQLEGHQGTSPMNFTVSLDQESGKTIRVWYRTVKQTAAAPADYAWETGMLEFAPGDTVETIDIAIRGDATVEGNETFRVELYRPVNTCLARGASVATGTIQNDDGPARRR